MTDTKTLIMAQANDLTTCQGGLVMVIRILVSGLMLMLLLGLQAAFLPETARAATCCPCSYPCKTGCICRGTVDHCPSCRGGEDSFFQTHVKAIISASDFSSSYELPTIALRTPDLSDGIVALVREGNRSKSTLTSRLLPGPEFRIMAWCPGTLDKSI